MIPQGPGEFIELCWDDEPSIYVVSGHVSSHEFFRIVRSFMKEHTDLEDEDWEEAFEFNLLHAVRLSRQVIPEIKKAGGGAILNIASIAGRESGSAMTYNASKAALISFSKALAQQVAKEQ